MSWTRRQQPGLSRRSGPAYGHRRALVFGSTNEGNVVALDADTGRPLWDSRRTASASPTPVSFLIDGRQHLAVACGQALFVFNLP